MERPRTPSPVIVALDFDKYADAESLVEQLDPGLCRLKVGKELFTRCGPAPVADFVNRGFDVFLDLKFHDIPNTTGADTLLIGVTVLTRMESRDLREVGVPDDINTQVARLAGLAHSAGLHGVVCSAREASMVREQCGSDFLRVTPGIRPRTAVANDQRRTTTPAEALALGSTHLVVGRPITASEVPSRSVLEILAEIREH